MAESFGFIQFPLYPLVKTSSDHGVQLLRRHPKLCLPFEFDLSPSFEIIKYPFIDFQVYENERLIPWKGSGDFSGMEQDTALTAGIVWDGDEAIEPRDRWRFLPGDTEGTE